MSVASLKIVMVPLELKCCVGFKFLLLFRCSTEILHVYNGGYSVACVVHEIPCSS